MEFSLVVFLLVVILFSILEGGPYEHQDGVTSAARDARVCAVEGGDAGCPRG